MLEKRKRLFSKKLILPGLTLLLFVLTSYLSNRYADVLLNSDFLRGPAGELGYALIMTAAVIVAPFETLPILPVAATLWGPNLAAILTIIGWTAGSLIAFGIARILGRKIVCKFASLASLKEWADMIKPKNIFWLVAFARFVLPIDIISYAVGLFTKMPWYSYLAATVIGIIPFAYMFSYGSQLRHEVQIVIAVVLGLTIFFRYNTIKSYIKRYAR